MLLRWKVLSRPCLSWVTSCRSRPCTARVPEHLNNRTFPERRGPAASCQGTRACLQLSRMIAETKCTAARKFRASLS